MGTDIMGSDSLLPRTVTAMKGTNGNGFLRTLTLVNTSMILLLFLMFFVVRSQDMAELRQSLEVARQERRDLQKSVDELNKKAILRGP